MSKNPRKNIFNVTPIDSEELRKSIAKDLGVADRPLTVEEIQRLESIENTGIAPVIDWSFEYKPDAADLRAEEDRLMDEVD